METTFIHELERILQVNTSSESWKVLVYTPSASDIFCAEGFDFLLNGKKFHFKPIANPDLEEALKTFHGILAESVQPELAYELSLGSQSNFYWMVRAAELGHAEAQCDLGDCYYHGRNVALDYYEAVRWYRKAAEQGNENAQNQLGECYLMGHGISKDYIEAVKWYTKSAQQGNAEAQYNLGYCHKYGYGVAKNYANAAKWYRMATEQGHRRAQEQLSEYYKHVGDSYYNGKEVPIDYAEAVKWYQKAAKLGNSWAYLSLSYMYRDGKGVPQNQTVAKKCYDMYKILCFFENEEEGL